MHAKISSFFTTKKEQPSTKVNERGHPGSISCQQSVQLFNPQKASWAASTVGWNWENIQNFLEIEWNKATQGMCSNKGSISHVLKERSNSLPLRTSPSTFANLPFCKSAHLWWSQMLFPWWDSSGYSTALAMALPFPMIPKAAVSWARGGWEM